MPVHLTMTGDTIPQDGATLQHTGGLTALTAAVTLQIHWIEGNCRNLATRLQLKVINDLLNQFPPLRRLLVLQTSPKRHLCAHAGSRLTIRPSMDYAICGNHANIAKPKRHPEQELYVGAPAPLRVSERPAGSPGADLALVMNASSNFLVQRLKSRNPCSAPV